MGFYPDPVIKHNGNLPAGPLRGTRSGSTTPVINGGLLSHPTQEIWADRDPPFFPYHLALWKYSPIVPSIHCPIGFVGAIGDHPFFSPFTSPHRNPDQSHLPASARLIWMLLSCCNLCNVLSLWVITCFRAHYPTAFCCYRQVSQMVPQLMFQFAHFLTLFITSSTSISSDFLSWLIVS